MDRLHIMLQALKRERKGHLSRITTFRTLSNQLAHAARPLVPRVREGKPGQPARPRRGII